MSAARLTLSLAALLIMAAAPPAPVLRGTYQADCAPYDGAAFRVTLPAGRGRQIELRANAPLEQMAGTWTHDGGNARPGTATILSCRISPERVCDYPGRGTFTILGRPGGVIRGSFTAYYPNARLETRRFTASPLRSRGRETGRMLCG